MKIVKLEIPVPSYEKDSVFHQCLYFSESPTKQEVLDLVASLHDRDKVYPEYDKS